MRSLSYLYDPLCGWCYAAAPSIARLRAAGVQVTPIPTGLFSGQDRLMTADFADYAWKNDQRIATMTGQVFTDAYRRQVLQAFGTAFDSSNATLALSAVAMDEPEREIEALSVLQKSRYISGLDITDVTTICEILADAAFPKAADALNAPAAPLIEANAKRVAAGAAKVREVGGRGVPTLVLVEGSDERLLDGHLLYGPPEALLSVFEIGVAA